MKIAQISPLYESVPPKLYGGTERVVSYLTEELVNEGCEVTLFASGDSITSAKLVSVCDKALRLDPECRDSLALHVVQMEKVRERSDEFDILHYHTDYLHFPISNLTSFPNITTLHGRLDLRELQYVYNTFGNMPVVSISNDQRKPLPQANWVETIYHGLPLNLYKRGEGEGGYAAFIGRVSPEKRLDRAIEIAKRAGIKLKIAAKIDSADSEYFKKEIEHLMDDPLVEFVGEIGEDKKGDFLGKASCLLFPIDWPEPFGMVMIEAMACGTPVIAFRNGSVPEVISHNKSGFIVNNIDEAVKALSKLHTIERKTCRELFEARFSVNRMARDYIRTYERIIDRQKSKSRVYNFQNVG